LNVFTKFGIFQKNNSNHCKNSEIMIMYIQHAAHLHVRLAYLFLIRRANNL
jgi:hypothetical protein